jgi:hypothetical protein
MVIVDEFDIAVELNHLLHCFDLLENLKRQKSRAADGTTDKTVETHLIRSAIIRHLVISIPHRW